MTLIEFLDKTKKNKILAKLDEFCGVSKLNHLFIKSGKDKIRIFSGSLSKDELNVISQKIHVELIGSRIANIDSEETRIAFDAINIPEIKNQINENIIEITDEQAEKWMTGEDLQIETTSNKKYVVVKNRDDLLGVGKIQGTFIKNYVPKERRAR